MPHLPAAERDRLPLWIPVLFGGGILLYFSLPVEPSVTIAVLFLSLTLGGYLAIRRFCHPERSEGSPDSIRFFATLRMTLLALAVLAAGFATAQHRVIHAKAPVIADGLDTVWVRGRVEQIEPQEHGARIYLSELDLWQPERKKFPPEETPTRARITVRTAMDGVEPGDYVGFRAMLSPPPRFPPIPAAMISASGPISAASAQWDIASRTSPCAKKDGNRVSSACAIP